MKKLLADFEVTLKDDLLECVIDRNKKQLQVEIIAQTYEEVEESVPKTVTIRSHENKSLDMSKFMSIYTSKIEKAQLEGLGKWKSGQVGADEEFGVRSDEVEQGCGGTESGTGECVGDG